VTIPLVNRESRVTHFEDYYIYIIYTPNLGLVITAFDREREQGRFRGSNEGAGGEHPGSKREQRGSRGEHRGSTEGAKEPL